MSKDKPPDRGKKGDPGMNEDMEIEIVSVEKGIASKVTKKIINKEKKEVHGNEVSGASCSYIGISKNRNNADEQLINKSSNINNSGQKNETDLSIAKNVSTRTSMFYSNSDPGPYVVYVQNDNGNIGKWHRISTAKLIINSAPEIENNINRITPIGVNRVKVELSTAESANKLLNSKILLEKEYSVFIPQFLKRRLGIIKGVDRDLSEEELIEIIKPTFLNNFEVLQVKRLKKKIIQDDTPVYIPKQIILVSFKGQILPKQVVIEKIVFNVEPYVQRVVQCLKCLRYGHLSTQCKGVERCSHCGENHDSNNCESAESAHCILCKGNHSATNRNNCPEFTKQKYIKNIMGTENLSYKDALLKYKNSYSHAVQVNLNSVQNDGTSQINTNSVNHQSINNYPKNNFNRSTQPTKRKRTDRTITSNNSLLEAHKELVTPIQFSSQPIINKYPPQYHNIKPASDSKNLTEKLSNSIKETFQSYNISDDSLIKIISENIIKTLQHQCII